MLLANEHAVHVRQPARGRGTTALGSFEQRNCLVVDLVADLVDHRSFSFRLRTRLSAVHAAIAGWVCAARPRRCNITEAVRTTVPATASTAPAAAGAV